MKDTISKFANHYKDVNYSFLLEQLEQSYKNVKSNMNIGLNLYNLAIETKRILTIKKSA